jgi:hypothetical protein
MSSIIYLDESGDLGWNFSAAGGPPFAIFEGWGFVLLTGFVHHPLRKTLYLLGPWCPRFQNHEAWGSRFCGGSPPKGRRLGQPPRA